MRSADTSGDSEDRRLVLRIARGDRPAFERFYRAYVRRVMAFAADIVGSREIAEEVAGDTMVAIWQSAHRFRGRSHVLTWVLGIAHHKAVDAKRLAAVAAAAPRPTPAAAAPPRGHAVASVLASEVGGQRSPSRYDRRNQRRSDRRTRRAGGSGLVGGRRWRDADAAPRPRADAASRLRAVQRPRGHA